MKLFNLENKPINYTNKTAELIQRRRLQILVHSYLYYELDQSIVDDYTWSKWAVELIELQNKYPELSKKVKYYKEFRDFDTPSGYALNYRLPEIMNIAHRLIGDNNGH